MQFKSSMIAVAAVAGVALAQTNSFSVATPQTLVQCQPYQINITGGTPPFNIRVTEAGNVSNVIETLTDTSSRQVTWTVNIASGTTITLYVVDSTGASASSAISNSIGTGSNSCLNSSASVSTGGSGSTGNSSSGGSGSTSQSSGASSTTGGSNTSRTSSSAPSATSGSSTSGNNGAGQLSGFSAVVAGAVGVVVAALF